MDEASSDARFGKWSGQSCKSIVPQEKQEIDRNNRSVYGGPDIYAVNAEDCKSIKCCKKSKEGR